MKRMIFYYYYNYVKWKIEEMMDNIYLFNLYIRDKIFETI